jgi:hypothetical protein
MAPIQAVSNTFADYTKLRHIRVGPDDFKGPSEGPFDPDFDLRRFNLLTALDGVLDVTLQAWANAKLQCQEGQGMAVFMGRWRKLVEEDPRSAVVALVDAVFAAKQALMQPSIGIVLDDSADALFDIMKVKNDNNETANNSQWPLMSHLLPELSHWVIAIHAPNSHDNLQTLMTELLQSTFSSPYAMLGLHGQMCEGVVAKMDGSMPVLFIGDRVLRTRQATHGALRVLGLSTFVSKFRESVVSQSKKACSSCQKLRRPVNLKRCARCHCVCYCDRECQERHFCYQHRAECNGLKELYERYDGNPFIKTAEKQKAQLLFFLENFMYPKLIEDSRVMFTLKASLRDDIIHNREHACLWDKKLYHIKSLLM